MKKLLKVMVLVLAFALVFSLAGCSSKKAITADKFESIMKGENYDVSDGSGDDIDPDYDITEVRYVDEQDASTVFIEFGSTKDAKDFYKEYVDSIKEEIKDGGLDIKTTSKSVGDYQKDTFVSVDDEIDEYTIYYVRVKNTVLYVSIYGDSKSNIKAVDSILSKLGY